MTLDQSEILGHFGPYGGRFVPEALIGALDELAAAHFSAQQDPYFIAELNHLHETYTGTISEILMYNTVLSAANRQKIEGYLAWKWGFAGNLTASHPYKYDSPMV